MFFFRKSRKLFRKLGHFKGKIGMFLIKVGNSKKSRKFLGKVGMFL